jgi:hypothetical protein
VKKRKRRRPPVPNYIPGPSSRAMQKRALPHSRKAVRTGPVLLRSLHVQYSVQCPELTVEASLRQAGRLARFYTPKEAHQHLEEEPYTNSATGSPSTSPHPSRLTSVSNRTTHPPIRLSTADACPPPTPVPRCSPIYPVGGGAGPFQAYIVLATWLEKGKRK